MSAEMPNCTSCGAPLPAHAPQGLCPQCLLKAGLTAPTTAGGLQLRCPECRNPIEVLDEHESTSEITCPSCGSTFNLLGDTITHTPDGPQSVGRFEIQDRLGIGAFGTVWKARDPELDRVVAIKIPRKERLLPEELQQFLREARSAAQIHHPNIVSVHEVGRDGDTVFIVSDYVSGVNLAEWLTARRLTFEQTARLCAQISEALHHAHESGVIHRDLKPSNIMLDSEGSPHVMDFGLAKRDAGEVTMTVDGKVLGTPAYMSPEQAGGHAHSADRRTDIYSLGVILYQLLTGSVPFRGASRMILHQTIHDEPPRPCHINRAIPRDLETICLKCLEKQPADRYATGRELADDLRRYLAGEPIAARPTPAWNRTWRWCRRHRSQVLLAGIASIAILLAVVLYGQYKAARTQQMESLIQRLLTAEPPDLKAVVSEIESRRPAMEPAIRDARQLAVSGDDTQGRLRLSLLLLPDDKSEIDFVAEQLLEGDAEARELFPLVVERLATNRQVLIQRMQVELNRELDPARLDPDEFQSWPNPDPADADRIEAAQGAIMDRFAFCSQLPLDEFKSLADRMAVAGYRPSRCRPYRLAEDETMVAAIWLRDGKEWQVTWDRDPSEITQDISRRLDEDLVLEDLAVYQNRSGELVYVGLFRKFDAADDAAAGLRPQAIVGATRPELNDQVLPLANQGLWCSSLQSFEDPHRQRRYTAICSATSRPTTIVPERTYQTVQECDYLDRVPIDVCVSPTSIPVSSKHPENYDVLWELEQPLEPRMLLDRSLPELSRDVARLGAEGFRAVSISVAMIDPDSAPRGCAILHRPLVSPEERDAFDRRRANAAVALMKAGMPDALWPHLSGPEASELRHRIIHLVEPFQVEPPVLWQRLESETDSDIRYMLILAVGQLVPERASASEALVTSIIDAHRDPHPGVHAAAQWLLNRWEIDVPANDADSESNDSSLDGLSWSVNPEGMTFTQISGPVEFVMGTPANENGRRDSAEHLHLRRIPRSFAISSTEVSLELFQRFRQDNLSIKHSHDSQFVTEDLTGPQTNVSWFQAAAFCRWLSEQEDMPREQMCYPQISEINSEMTLPENYLSRTGYRLPTEAEWEYACRAGTATSRFFGEAIDLLPEYARYIDNSEVHTWPPADRLPNPLGLFHMYGNVMEWCQDRYGLYGVNVGVKPKDRFRVIIDREESELKVGSAERVFRGGSFGAQASSLRSGFRFERSPDNPANNIGFRVARTLKSERSPAGHSTAQSSMDRQRRAVDPPG